MKGLNSTRKTIASISLRVKLYTLTVEVNIKTHPNEEQFNAIRTSLDNKYNHFQTLVADMKRKI
jgi:hypothetical protein